MLHMIVEGEHKSINKSIVNLVAAGSAWDRLHHEISALSSRETALPTIRFLQSTLLVVYMHGLTGPKRSPRPVRPPQQPLPKRQRHQF